VPPSPARIDWDTTARHISVGIAKTRIFLERRAQVAISLYGALWGPGAKMLDMSLVFHSAPFLSMARCANSSGIIDSKRGQTLLSAAIRQAGKPVPR
jgi:hypothetical protein